MGKEKIIGIDLGTSNSQAAVMLGGKPTIIPSAEGATVAGKMFPSVVAFTKDGQLLVGEPARRQAVTNPDATVMAAKRKMGTDHVYRILGKTYTPQQISAFILQKIKKDAEAFLGEEVKKAVITVPAYFNDNQRTATKDAGKIAGLDVVRLVNEPTAASMAYGLDKGGEHKILVFDLGGGTLDVTIMEFGDGTFNVLSTSGDTQLGGTDMDKVVMDWIVEEFRKQEGMDLKKDRMAVQRVREAAEKAKIELSTVLETEINLPYITADKEGPKHLSLKLNRSKLEQLVAPIIKRCVHPLDQALSDAKLTKEDIDRVILVGGPTRMPIVQKFIEDQVGKKVERGVDPMECVATGGGHPGRDPWRRGDGPPPPGCHPPHPRHRDPGRREDHAHRAEHHDTRRERARSSPRQQTSSPRSPSMSSRGSAPWPPTTSASGGSTWSGSRPRPGSSRRSR